MRLAPQARVAKRPFLVAPQLQGVGHFRIAIAPLAMTVFEGSHSTLHLRHTWSD
jgi:hypothetical protein